MGKCEQEEASGKVKFDKKALTIPASSFKNFCECLNRAHSCFQADDGCVGADWEKVLYKYTRVFRFLCCKAFRDLLHQTRKDLVT